ncbi:MAG: porin [Pseudomonadota bacterium]|nr:porin [Pseudomonadota bacterium]
MRSLLLAGGATLALATVADAADLPSRNGAAPAREKPDGFASFRSWLDAAPSERPLSFGGVTLYGQIDLGAGYSTHAARFNDSYPNGVAALVGMQSQGGAWQAVPSGLGRSNIGLKWKEPIVADWYLIGDVNAGFDPYSLRFSNGPASLAQNSTIPQINQTANGDSSRAYGLINTDAFAGVSNKTFGALTYGRQYSFSNDNDGAYDPFGGAYAFSLIGAATTLGGGLGVTELSRYNNAIKYEYADHGLRIGAMSQLGGYAAGNSAQYAFETDIGFDYAGFSFDGVYQYGKDAVTLAVWGTATAAPTPTTLKAIIADANALQLVGKYKRDKFQAFGGYQYGRLTDPSDLPAGTTLRPFNGGYVAAYGIGQQGLGATGAFPHPKVTQVGWIGGKYAVAPNLDLTAGYFHVWQNDYSLAAAKVCGPNAKSAGGGYAPQGTVSLKCAGGEDAISGLIDWRPLKRVDLYVGAMYSKVRGGMAKGYFVDNNTAVTGGVRVSF